MIKKLLIMIITATVLSASSSAPTKLLLILITKDGCHWCEKLERESFYNPMIRNQIEKHFMVANISRESGNIPSFLEPELFPTIYILDSDGKKLLFTIVGYEKSSELLNEIEEVYETRFSNEK